MPSDLEGIAYIQVLIQKESAQLVTANLSHTGAFPGGQAGDGAGQADGQHWQRKLEAAQNVLFCKELFSQLAKEAISLQVSDEYISLEVLFTFIQGSPSSVCVLGFERFGTAELGPQ